MEELFEAVVAVVVVVACVLAKEKKGKPQNSKPKATHAKPMQAVREAAENALKAVVDELPEETKQAMVEFGLREEAHEPIQAAEEAVCEGEATEGLPEALGENADFVDEHGCIGGSLGEHEAEGESKDEHEEHLLRAKERIQTERASAAAAKNAREAARARLRSSIVWSEILDRPVSMRSR